MTTPKPDDAALSPGQEIFVRVLVDAIVEDILEETASTPVAADDFRAADVEHAEAVCR